MWTMILSLEPVVEDLQPAFTQPSFGSACDLLLAWVMCLGPHTLRRVGQTVDPQCVPDHSQRHGLDAYYNFFARSAWTASALGYRVAVLLLTRLKLFGRITLLVDDTLAHKRGKCVWGLGWFRDAVASTKKRVATASGHNWVVLAVAYCLPFSKQPILALPLLARLHLPGKGQPSCAALVKEMLAEVLNWFPTRTFTLVGDGAYACQELLSGSGQPSDVCRSDAWGCRRVRSARATLQTREAWQESAERTPLAQAEGSSGQGGSQTHTDRGLAVASRRGSRLRSAAFVTNVAL